MPREHTDILNFYCVILSLFSHASDSTMCPARNSAVTLVKDTSNWHEMHTAIPNAYNNMALFFLLRCKTDPRSSSYGASRRSLGIILYLPWQRTDLNLMRMKIGRDAALSAPLDVSKSQPRPPSALAEHNRMEYALGHLVLRAIPVEPPWSMHP